MSRRTKFIIALVIIVMFLLLIGVMLIGRQRGEQTLARFSAVFSSADPTSSVGSSLNSDASPAGGAGRDSSAKPLEDVLALARSFAERYGSFSNQSNFENLEALYPFMTTALTEKSVAYIRTERAKGPARQYQGTTTRALGARATAGSGTEEQTILVSTQRQESAAAVSEARVYYQELELMVKKVGEEWKVERAEWK